VLGEVVDDGERTWFDADAAAVSCRIAGAATSAVVRRAAAISAPAETSKIVRRSMNVQRPDAGLNVRWHLLVCCVLLW
jgi:hypothetical protein